MENSDNIEQMIYTAAGKDGNGDFGIWSASMGYNKSRSSIEGISYWGDGIYAGISMALKEGNKNGGNPIFLEQTSYFKKLKNGIKPHGIFKNKYYDTDYQEIRTVLRNPIVILQESFEGDFLEYEKKYLNKHNFDFRENPEDAPYRIVAMKLLDGRLMVARRSFIGRIYSDIDLRNGNFFDHILIFPKGTEIEDLKKFKIPFKKGLKKGEFKTEMFPERTFTKPPLKLETIKITDLKKINIFSGKFNESLNNQNIKKVPEALFIRAEQILIWQKKLENLEISTVSNDYEIDELREKISRAEDYVSGYINQAGEKELLMVKELCNTKMEIIELNEKEKDLKKFQLGNYKSTPAWISLKKLTNWVNYHLKKRFNSEKE